MPTMVDRPRLYRDQYAALYPSGMVRLVILGVEAFRQQLKGRIEALADGEDTIVLRRSKFVGALISADEYREYRQLKGDPTEL